MFEVPMALVCGAWCPSLKRSNLGQPRFMILLRVIILLHRHSLWSNNWTNCRPAKTDTLFVRRVHALLESAWGF